MNVAKHYDAPSGSIPVLEDVSLRLDHGQAVAITGPSGSGKSTLLHVLGILDTPSSGQIRIQDENPFELAEDQQARFRNRNIGFVFQDHYLLPHCTAVENVLVPTLVAPPSTEYEKRARNLLETVGLSHRLHHKPAALSGGEKQRVAVARALILEPCLVLCDEPTGNLDESSASGVAALLLELHQSQKNALIVVTHNAGLTARFPMRFQLTDRRLNPA